MKKRLNLLSIVIVFALIFCVEIPFINRIFFVSEQYEFYGKSQWESMINEK